MKEFFENLGKVITEKAEVVGKKAEEVVEVVSKKTEQTVEIQKIKSQIHTMERNNERDYQDIGKMVYDKFKKGEAVDEQYVELCEAISGREGMIENAKKDVAELKGMDVCSNCGAHVEASAAFCSQCGAKVEAEAENAEAEGEAEFEDEE